MNSLFIGMLAALLTTCPLMLGGEETMAAASKRVVSPYKAVFRGLSKTTPIKTSVDGPLLGNGDMGVCLSEIMMKKEDGKNHQVANGPRFWLCKNDFWKLAHDFDIGPSGPRVFGGIDVKFPNLEGGSETEQNLYDAVTVSKWAGDKSGAGVEVRSWVAASANMLVVELIASGKDVDVEVNLWVQEGDNSEVAKSTGSGPQWVTRKFARDVEIETEAACAMKMLGATASSFKLKPGQPVTLLAAMQSKFKTPNPLESVRKSIEGMDQAALAELKNKHAAWWQGFWAKSFVEIGDPLLEQRYYLSHYVMACASRDPEFPPPIFGTWNTTDGPGWQGDYHLNYNHMAPYYGLYSSNHIEQADPYHAPLMDFRPRAQWYAKNAYNIRGVIYPVGIGPKGIETSLGLPDTGYARPVDFAKGGLFYSQKSNGAYALVNVAMRWRLTYDKDYARKLYPLVRDVADFWEDYLKFQDGRYVIENDSVHERSQPGDFNSIVSLGLVRNALELAIDMGSELGIDADRHPKWRHILDHLSGWSYQELALPRSRDEDRSVEKPKVKVFRYTEKGTPWWRNNTLAIQHIYPAGAIGLDSPPEELEVARNTLDVRNGWFDGNGMNSFYPAAVRVGYDPEVILRKLREVIAKVGAPNGFIKGNPHGIENCSTFPNAINEMLCMSHKGVLRLFPVWPKDKDARFATLRAWGAFLVSAELKGGVVQYVEITSEQGRPCMLVNPWPGRLVTVTRGDGNTETLGGERFAIETRVGQTLRIVPHQGKQGARDKVPPDVSRNPGKTPPMGWNSYNKFGLGVTAQLIREIADGVKKHKLDEAGYKYIVMDDGWEAKSLGPNGELIANRQKFPEGIAPLVKYVKGLGLELGIYSSPNKLTCGGFPGSLGLEDVHARQFAEWGVKFVKYDYCPTRNKEQDLPPDKIIERYKVFHDAIKRHDPEMVIALCEKGWAGRLNRIQRGGDSSPITQEERRAAFHWCSEVGVMWRTTGDIAAKWSRIMQILDEQEGLAPLSGPNSFNDPDMLEVGNGNLTQAENRAHFSLWCVLNAPLILGNDLKDIPGDVLEVLTNREVIALNQDPLCKQAEKVVDTGDIEIFLKPLANGALGVCVFNRGGAPAKVTLKWQDLGLDATRNVRVRDLWKHQDLGSFTGTIDASVDSHDVVVYRITEQ